MAFGYVLIPFKNSIDVLADCIESVLPQLSDGIEILLIDDGSTPEAAGHPLLKNYLEDDRVHLLRHKINLGPAQARNSGLAWCRDTDADIAILLDSDCLAKPGFVSAHVQLHKEHPEKFCIGGAIQGQGVGAWAKLDALMSWFSSVPNTPARFVNEPYHLPTTNLSFKLKDLAEGDAFEPRLKTGEDVLFIKELRARGITIFFSPKPGIFHRDRERMVDFFRHQYRWGLHTYVLRAGLKNLSPWRRLFFFLAFIPGFPVYVLLATWLNLAPYLKTSKVYFLYSPLLLALYVVKGIAVMSGTISPEKALYRKNPSGV